MKMAHLQLGLRTVASLAWGLTGLAKLWSPVAASVAGFEIGVPLMVLVGFLELGVAVAWWSTRYRCWVPNLSLWMASSFALALISGLVDTGSCACFGSMQVEKSRHLMVLATMIMASGTFILIDNKAMIGQHPGSGARHE